MLIDYIINFMNSDPEYDPTVFVRSPIVEDVPPECIPIENEYFIELQAIYGQLQDLARIADYTLNPLYPVIMDLDAYFSCNNPLFAQTAHCDF